MKRPKIKPPKTAPSPCDGQLPLFDRMTMIVIETDCDPDYQRVFAELLQEMN